VSQGQQADAHYPLIWQRAVLSGTVARNLGEVVGLRESSDLFLAALLQDLGVFALGQAVPDLYQQASKQLLDHASLQSHEYKELGADHAVAGAYLLRSWGLPERICHAIERSHDADFPRFRTESDKFDLCVQLAGVLADCVLREEGGRIAQEIAALAERCLGLNREQFAKVLDSIRTLLPEMHALFDIDTSSGAASQATLDKARAAVKFLSTGSDSGTVVHATTTMSRARELEDPKKRDALTGLFNHEALTGLLEREFRYAVQNKWPLALLILSADPLAAIWKSHGSAVHQEMLSTVARLLFNSTRDTDVVARYATDRFVIILPGAVTTGAEAVARRIETGAAKISMPHGVAERMALWIGISTLDTDTTISTPQDFLTVAESRLAHQSGNVLGTIPSR
jgi:diguanylate cyclase (GGDEF)-like protein